MVQGMGITPFLSVMFCKKQGNLLPILDLEEINPHPSTLNPQPSTLNPEL
jgi:hypothetical protein